MEAVSERNSALTVAHGPDGRIKAAEALRQRIRHDLLDERLAVYPALVIQRVAIDAAAFAGNVDTAAFAQLLELALQPVLWEARGRSTELGDPEALDRWYRGVWPGCGASPARAELVGPERGRGLGGGGRAAAVAVARGLECPMAAQVKGT